VSSLGGDAADCVEAVKERKYYRWNFMMLQRVEEGLDTRPRV
jgi:hypothetical protein